MGLADAVLVGVLVGVLPNAQLGIDGVGFGFGFGLTLDWRFVWREILFSHMFCAFLCLIDL